MEVGVPVTLEFLEALQENRARVNWLALHLMREFARHSLMQIRFGHHRIDRKRPVDSPQVDKVTQEPIFEVIEVPGAKGLIHVAVLSTDDIDGVSHTTLMAGDFV